MNLQDLDLLSNEELTKKITEMAEPYAQQGVAVGLATGSDMDEELVRKLTDDHRALTLAQDASPGYDSKCSIFRVYDSPEQAINSVTGLNTNNALYGAHDANWLYYYLMIRQEFGLVEETNELIALIELTKHVGWMWFGRTATIVTRRPDEIHLLTKHTPNDVELPIQELHNPNGMALKYRDGTGVYALNGLVIPDELQWVITDKTRRSNYKEVLTIKNAEIRTEVLKLFDAENIEASLPKKLIHSWTCNIGGNYELYTVTFDQVVRKYLKMKCPSKGDTPFQAVHPDCNTCQQALNWREIESLSIEYIPPLART